MLNCCPGGICCPFPCNACINNGYLSGGAIAVDPNPACAEDTITFTLSGVMDNAGTKRENCRIVDDGPGPLSYTWTLTLPPGYPEPSPPLTGSGAAASVVAKVPGTYSCTFTAHADRECRPGDLTVAPASGSAFRLDITTPTGDPTTTTGANSTNERTYSTGSSPTLTVPCSAGAVPEPAKLRWRIDDVGTIRATWSPHVSGDIYTGTGTSAIATYAGMPTDNASLGAKTITLTLDGSSCQGTQTVEVFFPKFAANHPGGQGGSPNWFHYWRQAVGSPPGLVYQAIPDFGRVRAMLFWNYAVTLAPKNEITVGDAAADLDPGCPQNQIHGAIRTTGIAAFWDTILHEGTHVQQIAAADPLVSVATGTPWENGWSWNQAHHNHWGIGPDGRPGRPGVDDDFDGTVDNLRNTGPGELGRSDTQVIPVGHGQPSQVCITAGQNQVLDSAPVGDDQAMGASINSGPDGICQSAAAADDVQVVLVGNGKPSTSCILPGRDGVLHTGEQGDDVVVTNTISSGPNGICESQAGQPNPSDDVDLETVAPGTDWPDAWGAPPAPPYCQGGALEHKATEAEPDDDTLFSNLDWGDPGKNHKTIGKYDD